MNNLFRSVTNEIKLFSNIISNYLVQGKVFHQLSHRFKGIAARFTATLSDSIIVQFKYDTDQIMKKSQVLSHITGSKRFVPFFVSCYEGNHILRLFRMAIFFIRTDSFFGMDNHRPALDLCNFYLGQVWLAVYISL